MSNELKTYTLQELYAHPMEPISWLAEGLLAVSYTHLTLPTILRV